MDLVFLLGRLLLGGYFMYGAYHHLTRLSSVSTYTADKHVPWPKLTVVFASLALIFGGLGIIFGVYVRLAIIIIGIFLIVASFKIHNFWSIKDPVDQARSMANFFRNMALLGALLMLYNFTDLVWPYVLGWGN